MRLRIHYTKPKGAPGHAWASASSGAGWLPHDLQTQPSSFHLSSHPGPRPRSNRDATACIQNTGAFSQESLHSTVNPKPGTRTLPPATPPPTQGQAPCGSLHRLRPRISPSPSRSALLPSPRCSAPQEDDWMDTPVGLPTLGLQSGQVVGEQRQEVGGRARVRWESCFPQRPLRGSTDGRHSS